jgi:hypothetical protein
MYPRIPLMRRRVISGPVPVPDRDALSYADEALELLLVGMPQVVPDLLALLATLGVLLEGAVAPAQNPQRKCHGKVDGTPFAQQPVMPRKSSGRRAKRAPRSRPASQPSEEELQGPPPREATVIHTDRERVSAEEIRRYTGTGPELSGGDVDADWRRAASVGEEAVGGTVATPDQNVVDELGDALGVPRALDEEFRTAQEILEDRDRHRAAQEG